MTSAAPGSHNTMTVQTKSEETIDIYAQNKTPWAEVEQQIVDNPAQPGQSYWLATTNADGSPHVVGIGALWVDGSFYIASGRGTRKSRNLERDPRCVVSTALPGHDVTVEGEATLVADQAKLEYVAAAFAAHGWAPTVREGAFWHEFSAQSAGRPPWHLYEIRPTKAVELGTAAPHGATRYVF